MKTVRLPKTLSILVLMLQLGTLTPASLAQTPLPDDMLRPIIPPGTAGKEGSHGIVPLSESPAVKASVADMMENPRAYAGRNVTVVAELEEIFAPWSMKLDENRIAGGGIDADLLVIGSVPLHALGLDPSWIGSRISVTGTVRILQASDFRREYGRGTDDRLFRRYEGRPALIATSLEKAE